MNRAEIRTAAVILVLIGLAQAAQAGYIHTKALLAQALIHRAWLKAEADGGSPKPWPWADTAPVARLGAPDKGIDLIVLAGGSGRTLAFGPGHITGTALPGNHGNVAIGGHRDTHFRFLKDLAPGDLLLMESSKGVMTDYVVMSAAIVDRDEAEVLRDYGDDRLTLITCYPFDAVQSGGRKRYVVTAARCDPLSNIAACQHVEM